MTHHQHGFTLVELMVAMAIGAVIILGAGQLFLTTFQTFQNVAQVSRKHETLIFAVSVLTEKGRLGHLDHYAIIADQRSVDGEAHHYCVLQDEIQHQPLVDLARVDNPGGCPALSVAKPGGVSYEVTLPIGDCREGVTGSCDEVVFTISERNKAIPPQVAAP